MKRVLALLALNVLIWGVSIHLMMRLVERWQ